MAKRQKAKAFSFQGFDAAHYKTTAAYTRAVNALFDKATSDIAEVAHKENYDPDKPFDFDDYPKAKAQLQKTLKGLASKMQAVIETGSRRQWLFACNKNDEFIASIIDTTKLTKGRLQKMQDRNLDALQSFQARKVGGMSLADRVWKYTEQYKAQIELGLDVGLGEGRSAQQLSRDLRQNLQDPNRLFRRVRDKRGNLQLSKAAKAFHPGQGVYRSSYKNAMRLTRSEINMAYREADHLRWQQLDFVVGFEVHRSNHEPKCKCVLCERLVGKYPKWFKFKGWHPQCLCYATAILMDEDDFDKQELSDLKSALKGTEYRKLSAKNEVTELPDGFKDWVAENEAKQANWASTPYFIKDNFVDGDLSKGLVYVKEEKPLTLLEKAAIRHKNRTSEQVEAIQKRWEERRHKHALIKQEAQSILDMAMDYGEVDYSALQNAIDAGDVGKMQSIAKEVEKVIGEMQKQEEALYSIIPNVHEWHKQFTIDELKGVYSAVEKKLASWNGLTLQEQSKKLKFEAEEYFGTDKYGAQTKYKTWGVAQDAYKMHLDKVQYKIDKQEVEASVSHSFSFAQKTKSAKVKQLVSELQSLLGNNATIAELQSKADALNNEVSKLEAAKLARDLKKLSKLGNGFSPDAYMQERKDRAVWDKGSGKVADKTLIDVAAKNWIASTEDEKDRVYEYTHHYCNVNEPLQGRKYLSHQTRADFEHRVNNITSYISKNLLPEDMWFMRGDDGLGAIASRIKFAGGEMPTNLQDLVGMTMQEGGFMSTGSRKGKGFNYKPVVINVYAPKGTQAAYIEPISAYGNGAGRKWDGKQRFSTFSSEHETLFQRGTLMRITKVYQVGGKTFIDCEVVGQEIKPLSYVSDSNIGY
jgi:hypothetical protein